MSRKRVGKTRKDLESGATERRLYNQTKRVSWQNDGTGRTPFPKEICNGKKNTIKKHNSKAGK